MQACIKNRVENVFNCTYFMLIFYGGKFMKLNDDSNVSVYFKSLSHKQILTKEETNELILIAQKTVVYGKSSSITARNLLIEKNQGFINMIAQKFIKCLGHGMEFEDLMMEANFGLVNAINNFKVEKGFCFITYAKVWVYNALQIAVNRQVNPVYVPLKADVEKKDYFTLSLDSSMNDEDSCSLGDLLMDKKNPGVLERITDENMQHEVREILDVLGERERFIVEKYYGLDGKEFSLMDISKNLNISKERVRQIRCAAEKKLRHEAEMKSMQYYLVA